MKTLSSQDVFGYLIKCGHQMSRYQWIDLNVEGSINIELTQEQVSYINAYSKVKATMRGLSVCA